MPVVPVPRRHRSRSRSRVFVPVPRRNRTPACSLTSQSESIALALGGMRINVQTPTGQTHRLGITREGSLTEIKSVLEDLGYPTDGYKLLMELQEGPPIRPNPIAHNATLFLVKTAYRISVIHGITGKWEPRFYLEVEASDTIYKVKGKIQAATICSDNEWGCPREVQQLYCRGSQLVTGTLSDYNVQEGATIVCTWYKSEMEERLRLYERFGP